MKGLFIFPVLLIFLFGTPAFADLEKGRDAYSSGDFATALKEFKPLAKQGDANGQLGGLLITRVLHFVGEYISQV